MLVKKAGPDTLYLTPRMCDDSMYLSGIHRISSLLGRLDSNRRKYLLWDQNGMAPSVRAG